MCNKRLIFTFNVFVVLLHCTFSELIEQHNHSTKVRLPDDAIEQHNYSTNVRLPDDAIEQHNYSTNVRLPDDAFHLKLPAHCRNSAN